MARKKEKAEVSEMAKANVDLHIKDSKNLKSKMRRFVLWRHRDSSGNSGEGLVAEGTMFSSGRVTMTWLSHLTSVGIYDNIEIVEQLHSHNGNTEIIWIDDEVK